MKKRFLAFSLLLSFVSVSATYAIESNDYGLTTTRSTIKIAEETIATMPPVDDPYPTGEDLREKLQEQHQQWSEKLEEFKNARTEQKSQIKAQLLEKTKERAKNALKKAIERFKKIKSRVNKLKVISETEKATIVAKIDEQISALGLLEKEIEDATTADEVKTVMAKIKTELKTRKEIVKDIVKAIHATHLENVITRMQGTLTKLEAKIASLKTAGKDVSTLETLAASAKTKLETALTQTKAYNFLEAKKSIVSARLDLVKLEKQIRDLREKEDEEDTAETTSTILTTTTTEAQNE